MGVAGECEVSGHQTLVGGAFVLRWNVSDSPVNDETVTFTVNDVTAQEQLGAYEPLNITDEFAVKLGFRF